MEAFRLILGPLVVVGFGGSGALRSFVHFRALWRWTAARQPILYSTSPSIYSIFHLSKKNSSY